MNYKDTLDYIYNALPMYQRIGSAAYKADLDNAYELDKLSGFAHKHFKTIHVAGTNGKGSVSHMLASILQKNGYKTGLYTSPHLTDFRERIKINGTKITKEFIIKYIERNRLFFDSIKPSFFEMSVFMAFCYFKINKVDVAIVETGLGGRLDTTNIIYPIASVITNIGLDHTQFLGNTLVDVTKEKAGIIKHCTPLIIGERQDVVSEVIDAKAALVEARTFYASDEYQHIFSTLTTERRVKHRLSAAGRDMEIELDLLGSYQVKNLITALKTCDIIQEKLPLTIDGIMEGLKTVIPSTGLKGRWQETNYNPLTVCDVAHNKEGLTETLKQIYNTPHKNLHMILGFVKDKNLDDILDLFPKNATYYFTRAENERSVDPELICAIAAQKGLCCKKFYSLRDAVTTAKQNAENEDFIYIGGSTFLVADYLKFEKK